MILPSVTLEGDVIRAETMRGFALSQLRTLHNAMSFQDLKQDVRRINLADGSAVEVKSNWSLDSVRIFAPLVPTPVPAGVEVPSMYVTPEEEKEIEAIKDVVAAPVGQWSNMVWLKRYWTTYPSAGSFPAEVIVDRDGLDLWRISPHLDPDETVVVVTALETEVRFSPVYSKATFSAAIGGQIPPSKTLVWGPYEPLWKTLRIGYERPIPQREDRLELGEEMDTTGWQVWDKDTPSMSFGFSLVSYTSEREPYIATREGKFTYMVLGRYWMRT